MRQADPWRAPRAIVVVALGAASAGLASAPAQACGLAPSGTAPSLQLERVLMIHDAQKQREHFIRELAFSDADAPFGFIVPTPSRPEIAKVEGDPLAALPLHFPSGPSGQGFGADDEGGVRVLQVEKLGRFVGVVLAADDDQALGRWLTSNRFGRSEQLDTWLTHHVRLGSHFVALRYDPPAAPRKPGRPAAVRTETIRISFDTPLPYYPYLEPRGQGAATRRRAMQLWLVSTAAAAPVSLLQDEDGGRRWVRPLATLVTHADQQGADPDRPRPAAPAPSAPRAAAPTGEPLGDSFGAGGLGLAGIGEGGGGRGEGIGLGSIGTLGVPGPRHNRLALERILDDSLESLLPVGPLVVQVFEDQKTDRSGYGDILFTPTEPVARDAAAHDRIAPILRVLR